MSLERLSAFDASLARRDNETGLHTGSISIFSEGLSFQAVSQVLAARIHRAPMARKRLQELPLGGRAAWVDDVDFDPSFHLRHAAVPPPGGPGQVAELLTRAAVGSVTSPDQLAGGARTVVSAAGGIAGRLLGVSSGPFGHRRSPHRRFATARLALDDLREVRQRFSGTINDVVVAITGDGIGRLLRARGTDTTDLDLRIMIPVRVTGVGEASTTIGGGVVGVLAPLPVMHMDPVARLYRVIGELDGIKQSRQALGARDLMRLAGYGPAHLHSLAARIVSAERRYHVALSNAPGPQEPRYLAGVRMVDSYPFVPFSQDAALSVAVTSYDGGVCFGILSDRDLMPDIGLLPGFISEAADALLSAARGGAR